MNKKGFTLLEMVVVVMIIAILFLLTIPNVSKVIDSVDDNACDALTRVVDSAIVQYKLTYGQYPGSTSDLVAAGLLSPEQTSCSNGKSISISNGQAYHS
ncbi:MAG: prepilin-type N-terminal cleavage/methylation domain-containing protein [Erysipelotrichaceae bacterium]|nr:prepilin-type N-terminal cleavage/methylation domain-containing protein [Erysipelotrichaceae bacterium]